MAVSPFTADLPQALPPLLAALRALRQNRFSGHTSTTLVVVHPDVPTALEFLGFTVARDGRLAHVYPAPDDARPDDEVITWLDGLWGALMSVDTSLPEPEIANIADIPDNVLKSLESLGFHIEIGHDYAVWRPAG